ATRLRARTAGPEGQRGAEATRLRARTAREQTARREHLADDPALRRLLVVRSQGRIDPALCRRSSSGARLDAVHGPSPLFACPVSGSRTAVRSRYLRFSISIRSVSCQRALWFAADPQPPLDRTCAAQFFLLLLSSPNLRVLGISAIWQRRSVHRP